MEAFRRACASLLDRAGERPPGVPGGLAHDFLLLLSRPADPAAVGARGRLEGLRGDAAWGDPAGFLLEAAAAVPREVAAALGADADLAGRLGRLGTALDARGGGPAAAEDLLERFWKFFCPQAAGVRGDWEARVRALREERTVRRLTPCPDPVRRPAAEVLFAANVLLTVPPRGTDPAALALRPGTLRGVERALGEDQAFWYDHPIPVGTPPERNEIVHGLVGLSETLAFEKRHGGAAAGDRLQVVLSASVTHPALQGVARDYVEEVVHAAGRIRDLDLFVFTEAATEELLARFLLPAAAWCGVERGDAEAMRGVLGVDGPYARHYNFLKAAAPLWQVVRDPGVRATFKIDLDQVFPQERLAREAGASAFGLLRTPLWGAEGVDAAGRPVSLGLAAGALVNEADIGRGLFTPDVTLPAGPLPPERWVFASVVPQALSTEAEMMARHGGGGVDGVSACLSRVHVTGGTIGARVDALRRHRPFTLSCIGRAEDQAFLVSVLHAEGPRLLRYAHVPGLIMRHDKRSFAAEAIRSAAAGKAVGDDERVLLFSHYARALPWPAAETKAALDPFTGCFVVPFPLATALLGLALRTLGAAGGAGGVDAAELLRVGARRLGALMRRFAREPDWMRELYATERRGWGAFHDVLDRVERGRREGAAEALRLAAEARAVIDATRVAT